MFRISRVGRRLYSSLPELKQLLGNGEKLDKVLISRKLPSALAKVAQNDELEQVHHILTTLRSLKCLDDGDRTDLINQVLIHGLPLDYSLYFTVQKDQTQRHSWSAHALAELILSNPGRVDGAWDLLQKYGLGCESTADSDGLYRVVLEKLLFGERVELRDSEVVMSTGRLARAIYVGNKISNGLPRAATEKLVTLLKRHHCVLGINYASVTNQELLRILKAPSPDLGDAEFLAIFSKIFHVSPSHLDKDILCQGLSLTEKVLRGQSLQDTNNALEELKLELLKLDASVLSRQKDPNIVSLSEAILAYIEERKLDLDKSAESLLVRIKLMEVYGMDRDNIQIALAKFHQYQSQDPFGIELVQQKLVTAFCFQAVKHHNQHFLKIAHTLMTMDAIPIKMLLCLILAHSEFDDTQESKALNLYNEYINLVPKAINEVTKRSGAGVLTEAMVLASLYTNDREFAKLLFEMAIQNKVVTSDLDVASIKKLFKVYGEAFVGDEWELAKQHLKKYLLAQIRGRD